MRKLIKKILKESDELEWVRDIKSHQDIAQEIDDETRIDYDEGRMYTPFSSNSLPLLSPTYALHIRSPLHLPPYLSYFSSHCKERYGLNDDDINDVWERYKRLIKDRINDHHNINESNDLQWIKNVKSNQDIAQEIDDETRIDYDEGRMYTPFSSSSLPLLSFFFSFSPQNRLSSFPYLSYFSSHCKEVYGLNGDDINDVWERYKKLVRDRINNLHSI